MLSNYSTDFNRGLASLLDKRTFQVMSSNVKKESFDAFLANFFGFIPEEQKRKTIVLEPFGTVIVRRMVNFMGAAWVEVYDTTLDENVLVSINYRKSIRELSIWWNTNIPDIPDIRLDLFRAMIASNCPICHTERLTSPITPEEDVFMNGPKEGNITDSIAAIRIRKQPVKMVARSYTDMEQ